jgi:hypothetical protein
MLAWSRRGWRPWRYGSEFWRSGGGVGMEARSFGGLEVWRSCRYGSAEVWSHGRCAGMEV